MRTTTKDANERLSLCGVKPSLQRLEIMRYLMDHRTHPTVEDVYHGLHRKLPTLSRTTVYNTLRLLADHKAAQLLSIDDHRVCYDGDTSPHVHLLCRRCGRVLDLFDVEAPKVGAGFYVGGNMVDEAQLYYRGLCADCVQKAEQERMEQGEQQRMQAAHEQMATAN